MALHPEDGSQLLIRCPSCEQRFKVGVELKGRTVECGSCEHRFKIGDEVIVRGKKFYPGERSNPTAGRYHRVPIAVPPPENLKTIQYSDDIDASSFEPVSPLRLIAGAGAIVLLVLVAVMLFFGNGQGRILEGIDMTSRVGLGGFVAVIVGSLLIYANPRARKRAVVGALGCVALLVGIPLSQPDAPLPGTVNTDAFGQYVPEKIVVPDLTADEQRIARIREEIGTDPLNREIMRLQEMNSSKKAYGIWMRGLGRDNAFLVTEFLTKQIKAGDKTHAFPRGRSDYLIVVTEIAMDIEQLAEAIKVVAEVLAVHEEIDVIEARANPEAFTRGDQSKLTDRSSPAFYELNKRELESIDMVRVREAVARLTDAEPTQFRTDISRRLVALLALDGVDFKEQICQALLTWHDPSVGAGERVEALVVDLSKKNATPPLALVQLAAREKRTAVIPLVFREWKKDFSNWELPLSDFGQPVEPVVLEDFGNLDLAGKKSAVVLLGRVGGQASLDLFAKILPNADKEMRVRLEQAGNQITQRINAQGDQ